MALFSKKIEPSCSYCLHGSRIGDTEVACLRRGIVSSAGCCRKFVYDPLKREPPDPAPLDTKKYSQEDFSID